MRHFFLLTPNLTSLFMISLSIYCILILMMQIRHYSSTVRKVSNLVIGAGISGANIGLGLHRKGQSVAILEKSSVYGGRMATRRSKVPHNSTGGEISSPSYDHGAQYYSLKPIMNELHNIWLFSRSKSAEPATKYWFSEDGVERYCSKLGISTFVKSLCEGNQLDIQFNHKVIKLYQDLSNDNQVEWFVICENGTTFQTTQVIMTSPLPQSLCILDDSAIKYPEDLNKISYAKALVAMCYCSDSIYDEMTRSLAKFSGSESSDGFYKINNDCSSFVYSVVDQYKKGVSNCPAFTIVLNPNFSEKHFDSSSESISRDIITEMRRLFHRSGLNSAKIDPQGDHQLKFQEIKRWKYSHPLSNYHQPFITIQPGLHLAGDAFGGGSISGAVSSSMALLKYFESK